jgi:putative tricarboxylic transport membrane protein
MVMGLFGISEILANIEQLEEKRTVFAKKVKNLLPNRKDWKKSILPITRGSILGFSLGLIPGGGTILSSFISYAVEKKCSKNPEEFGKGAIEGVAGPETANNAAVGGAFVPLFALGIPSNIVMAILMSSFIIHGVAPSPGFIVKNAELFWGIVCSMYIGNLLLLILNLPLISIWVKLLEIPYKMLFPIILLFCLIGTYSLNYRTFDVLIMIIFGLVGYVLKKFDYELTPLVMAFVLGPMFETSLRQAIIISNGNISFIYTRPVALLCFGITLMIISLSLLGPIKKLREKALI